MICMVKWWKNRLVITNDHENNIESVNISSSSPIIPCPESSSLAVFSVKDKVNDNWNTTIEEEMIVEKNNFQYTLFKTFIE